MTVRLTDQDRMQTDWARIHTLATFDTLLFLLGIIASAADNAKIKLVAFVTGSSTIDKFPHHRSTIQYLKR